MKTKKMYNGNTENLTPKHWCQNTLTTFIYRAFIQKLYLTVQIPTHTVFESKNIYSNAANPH